MYLVAYIGISLMSYQWYKYIEKASNAPHTSNNIMPCNEEHFYLIGMESCYPYLHCKEINNEVELKETIGIGGVKLVSFYNFYGQKQRKMFIDYHINIR